MAISEDGDGRRQSAPVNLTPAVETESEIVSSQEEEHSSELLRDPAAEVSNALHSHFGNDMIAASLGGDTMDGMGSIVAGEMTLALGGVGESASSPMGSNAAMLKAMRDVEERSDYDANDASLKSLRTGGGETMQADVRERFERAMDHDFSHVRIHKDGMAATQSAALNAHAFTISADIWFGSGEYAPGTTKGDRLLAHELTHVKQHDEGRISPHGSDGLDVSKPSDPLEQEAYGNEMRVVGSLSQIDKDIAGEASAELEEDVSESVELSSPEVEAQAETDSADSEIEAGSEEELEMAGVELESAGGGGSESSEVGTDMGGDGEAAGGGEAYGSIMRGARKMNSDHLGRNLEELRDAGINLARVARGDASEILRATRELQSRQGRSGATSSGNKLKTSSGGSKLPHGPYDNRDEIPVGAHSGAPGLISFAHRASGLAAPDSEAADKAIRMSSGGKLPTAVATKMSRALGHDFSNVTIHTDSAAASAAKALNAHAFALGSELFFAEGQYDPSSQKGQELIAHELTHVKQAAEGRLPTAKGDGMEVSTRTMGVEQEAYAAQAQASEMLAEVDAVDAAAEDFAPVMDAAADLAGATGMDITLDAPAEMDAMSAAPAMAATGMAMRKDDGTEDTTGGKEEKASAPEKVELTLAGKKITIKLEKGSENLTQTVDINEEVLPGVMLETAEVKFDESWSVKSGKIDGKLTIGELIVDNPISLEIKDSGQVSASIKEVHIPMPGDLLKGTMDLEITSDGVGGETTFTFDQVDVGEGFTLDSGELKLTIEPGAETASAEGELKGMIADKLNFTLTVEMDNNQLAGNIDTTLEKPIDLGFDIKLTGASLGGRMNREKGTTIDGSVSFDLGGWATADIEASYALPAKGESKGESQGGGDGTDSETGVDPSANSGEAPAPAQPTGDNGPSAQQAPGPAEGGGVDQSGSEEGVETGGPAGQLDGASQEQGQGEQGGGGGGGEKAQPVMLPFPSPGKWNMKGTLTQTKDLTVSEGVSITDTVVEVNVKDNTLDIVTVSQSTINLPDNWKCEIKKGSYAVTNKEFSGEATVSLTEPKDMGNGLKLTEVVATGTVAGNKLTTITGNVTALYEKEGVPPFKLTLEDITYDVEKGELSGVARATLEEDYQLTSGSAGGYELVVKKETNVSGTLAANELTKVNGLFKLMLTEKGEDFISAEIDCEYPLTEGGKLSGTATAKIEKEKEVATISGNKMVLAKGSNLTATIADNEIEKVNGKLTLSIREDEEWATVELEGDYQLKGDESGFTGSAKLTVTGEKEVGKVGKYTLVIAQGETAAEATGHFEQSKLTKIDGKIPFQVKDGDGALMEGALSGEYTLESKMFTGTGSLYLARDVDYEVKGGVVVRVKKGTGGEASINANKVETITGKVDAELLVEGEVEFEFKGSGTYDVTNDKVTEATGTATLKRTLEPFGADVVQISNLTASAEIKDNALQKVTGGADIKIPKLNDSHGHFEITWEKDGDKDKISGEGNVHLVIIKGKDGRGAEGDVLFKFDGSQSFSVDGDIKYQITKAVGGTIGMKMDEKIDPEIDGTLTLNSELVPASDLFRKELDILPEQNIQFAAGPVPLVLKFGAAVGMGLGMQALVLSSEIGISKWKPLSENSTVPDFDAHAKLDWGLLFDAKATAWVSLGIGVSVLSAGGGMKGAAELDVPITAAADVNLHGGSEGFWGDLGISVGVSAGLSFSLKPYLYANLFSKKFEHDFDGWDWDLGEIAKFDWGTTYQFGDKSGEVAGSATNVPAPAAKQKPNQKTESKPDMGGSSTSGPAAKEGGPDLSGSGEKVAGDTKEEDSGGKSEMEERMDLIQDVAKGVASIGYLIEVIGDLLMWAAAAGPLGLVIRLVYKMIIGDITWGKLSDAVTGAIDGMVACYKLIKPYLPDWWAKLKKLIDDGINLFDEWWNGDTRMHNAVQKGEHLKAGPEMKAEMADRMLDFWSQEAHKRSVITLLESGDHDAIIAKVGWGTLKDKMTGWNASDKTEERFKGWCQKVGYGKMVYEEGYIYDSYVWKWTR